MENLLDWAEELKLSDKLVIVEGEKDEDALHFLGVKNVRSISRKPLFEFVESVAEKEVVILTDLDSEGRKLYSFLKRELSKRGKIIDNKFREFLFRETGLSCIEGLETYMKNHNILL